jgi:hemerythrin-like domain-containing protein
MGVLMAEHQRGKALVAALATATEAYVKGDASARSPLVENMRGIRDLYPNHIWKEDYLLFPMTNKILSPTEQEELQERFEAVEKEVGLDTHRRFELVVENLEKKIQGIRLADCKSDLGETHIPTWTMTCLPRVGPFAP